ncbi:hypothetical protein L1987_61536 [Smallanthus sonchifolius]|uniref:Uncharacterized protein n=1 Tax=Smallanthus sonchifolius TaxID=185202 RepID=A0ACB9C7V2_9ASTR|nr:hypothetical protein L1987_61536 [Smallanthus sonchifolius]
MRMPYKLNNNNRGDFKHPSKLEVTRNKRTLRITLFSCVHVALSKEEDASTRWIGGPLLQCLQVGKGGIAQDLRTDGRKRLTYRPILVETGVIAQANGSARVKMGKTEVIASVKAQASI